MWSCDQSLVTAAFLLENNHKFIFIRIWPKKPCFFEGWSLFKLNNFGPALGTNLKFYTSVEKGLKLKVRKFLGVKSYVFRNYRGKTGRGDLFASPSLTSWIGLNKNDFFQKRFYPKFLHLIVPGGLIKTYIINLWKFMQLYITMIYF